MLYLQNNNLFTCVPYINSGIDPGLDQRGVCLRRSPAFVPAGEYLLVITCSTCLSHTLNVRKR